MNLHLMPCCQICGGPVIVDIDKDVAVADVVHEFPDCPASVAESPEWHSLERALTRFMNS